MYVQFGDVFNLLHAGASYIRIHQKGFGVVGVSKKYGKRSWARYPIFWGLKDIGNLPNPDPSDTAPFSRDEEANSSKVAIDEEFEKGRAELKRQAQEWAGLAQNPKAELLVFVGRWSMQKGIDLIADIMPGVLHDNENVQLICVGPVIDLYGKFAALKLKAIMERFPDKVYSKPEFTALPPYIFSGAEFALIPSRDEPFGLVAVEFGRKGYDESPLTCCSVGVPSTLTGLSHYLLLTPLPNQMWTLIVVNSALGIGARVGGLGQMVCLLIFHFPSVLRMFVHLLGLLTAWLVVHCGIHYDIAYVASVQGSRQRSIGLRSPNKKGNESQKRQTALSCRAVG
jgi:hypothetical protein